MGAGVSIAINGVSSEHSGKFAGSLVAIRSRNCFASPHFIPLGVIEQITNKKRSSHS
jgi:hypothetical protein